MRDVDPQAVAALLHEVSRTELLPRFRTLSELVTIAKPSAEDPEDIVTEADEAAERVLAAELTSLLPGSIAIGEEATAKDASVRDALDDADAAWLIDPLDGTKNFAAGSLDFGSMVTLCFRGDAVAAWIHLSESGRTLVAQRGAGAWDGSARLRSDALPSSSPPRGTVYSKFMPPDVREVATRRAEAATTRLPGRFSAASEYDELLRGVKDFNLYWRLLPWDHAPGALLLAEAGGVLRHPDGRDYRAADREPFALAVRDASEWNQLRSMLLP